MSIVIDKSNDRLLPETLIERLDQDPAFDRYLLDLWVKPNTQVNLFFCDTPVSDSYNALEAGLLARAVVGFFLSILEVETDEDLERARWVLLEALMKADREALSCM